VEITDLVAPDRVVAGLRVRSKSHLLTELARRAAAATGLSQEHIREALEAREALGSTGIGAGIAMPHAQITGLDRFYGLFVRLDRPIGYEAIDERPVDLVFLLLIPMNTNEHLQALACVSRRLRDQAIATNLRRAPSDQEVYQALAAPPPQ
jgi:PTS system nitrogen regulatory IIA component